MMKSILRIGALSLLAAAIAAAPAQLLAQSTNTPAADKKTAVAQKDRRPRRKPPIPSMGSWPRWTKSPKPSRWASPSTRSLPQTKITKDGKPATLEDGVVGEPVSGYVKPTDDGKMAATTVHFGAKAADKSAEKRKGT